MAHDGSAIVAGSRPQPDGTLAKALARAWRWQRMLDDGVYASVSEIGEAENISKSYVSRILRLALLAPDIIEAILAGPAGPALMLGQLDGRCRRDGRSSVRCSSRARCVCRDWHLAFASRSAGLCYSAGMRRPARAATDSLSDDYGNPGAQQEPKAPISLRPMRRRNHFGAEPGSLPNPLVGAATG